MSAHPEIDEATLVLGIGWTKIASDNSDIQAAARGWARYLDNHYSRCIHNAEILLKSLGLNAYLVGCQEGFYLFAENLLEGRMVGKNWETTLQNLRSQPMIFEGEEVLSPERTPGPDDSAQPMQQQIQQHMQSVRMNNWADYNRLYGEDGAVLPGGGMDVD